MDITNFLNWFITNVINLFVWFFNLLQSITFYGTNLLEFCVAILILGVTMNVLLGLVQSRSIREIARGGIDRTRSGGKNEK